MMQMQDTRFHSVGTSSSLTLVEIRYSGKVLVLVFEISEFWYANVYATYNYGKFLALVVINT